MNEQGPKMPRLEPEKPEQEVNPEITNLQRQIKSLNNYLNNWKRDKDEIKTWEESEEERAKKTQNKYRNNYINSAMTLCQGLVTVNKLFEFVITEKEKQVLLNRISLILSKQREFSMLQHQYGRQSTDEQASDVPEGYESKVIGNKENKKRIVVRKIEELDNMIDEVDNIIAKTIEIAEAAIEKEQANNKE